MKRVYPLCVILLLAVSTSLWADNDRNAATAENLPATSREFLNTHFRNTHISYVEIDKYLFWISGYEVILVDGTEVNFARNGEWTEVERKKEAVPAVIIPKKITAYIKENFPKQIVLAIEKEFKKWEIKLNNGIELSFNKKEEIIEVDAD
ncbi:hypothetical protein M2480_000730 [Parabacteroides sp. PFB2-12]|uniref:PepSY-like domain-containing protein n=1 Tax=unclassified Parabacteroides TaxID=2649774 RepID=UPI002475C0C1|nr:MULTISPECIES: PepSY-like domain-containing protein [unclassified Parabacteroides]MDH6342702.1 hypothetical protein [Parabacteroides sp. PM6-13]MDH6389765.1 hypothetical protein [Parabacteroides sp. PFB2-12]